MSRDVEISVKPINNGAVPPDLHASRKRALGPNPDRPSRAQARFNLVFGLCFLFPFTSILFAYFSFSRELLLLHLRLLRLRSCFFSYGRRTSRFHTVKNRRRLSASSPPCTCLRIPAFELHGQSVQHLLSSFFGRDPPSIDRRMNRSSR